MVYWLVMLKLKFTACFFQYLVRLVFFKSPALFFLTVKYLILTDFICRLMLLKYNNWESLHRLTRNLFFFFFFTLPSPNILRHVRGERGWEGMVILDIKGSRGGTQTSLPRLEGLLRCWPRCSWITVPAPTTVSWYGWRWCCWNWSKVNGNEIINSEKIGLYMVVERIGGSRKRHKGNLML